MNRQAMTMPRVLVLSPAVPETFYAGSLLLYRMFEGYPLDRMRVVGPAPHEKSKLLPCEYCELKGGRLLRLNRTRLARLKRSLQALRVLPDIPPSKVEAAVGDWEADVVVCVMENSDYTSAAVRFSQRHRLPLVLILHDFIEDFEQVYGWAAPFQRRWFGSLYRAGSRRLCISGPLRDLFAQSYGAPSEVLPPIRSEQIHARDPGESLKLKNDDQLTLAYVGTMAYGYQQGLTQLLPTLEASGHRLIICSGTAPAFESKAVSYRGYLPAEEAWALVQKEADAVILPYSRDPNHERLYRTHFPSKLPEYLALGMPVLTSGPDYAAGVAWAARHPEAALRLPDHDPAMLSAALQELKSNPKLRSSLARHALVEGQNDFAPAKIRGSFWQTLSEAAAATMPEPLSKEA